MSHLYVTFRDTTGADKEIDVTAGAQSQAGMNTGIDDEQDYIDAMVRSGFIVISTRYAAPGSLPSPSPTPIPGNGCLLSILSIFGL